MAPFLDRSAGHVDRHWVQQMLAHKFAHIRISLKLPKLIASNIPTFKHPSMHYMPPCGESFHWDKNAVTRPGLCKLRPRRRHIPRYGENTPWPRMLSQGLGCETCAHQTLHAAIRRKPRLAKNVVTRPGLRRACPTMHCMLQPFAMRTKTLRQRRPALASGICNLRLFGRKRAGCEWRS